MTPTEFAPVTEIPEEKLWQLATEKAGGTLLYSTDKYLLNQIAQRINKECGAEGQEDPPAQVLSIGPSTREILQDSIEAGKIARVNELYFIFPWRS